MRDRTCATGLCERSCFNKTGNQGWEQPCSHDPGLSLRTELKFTKKWASPQSFHSPFGNNLHKMITRPVPLTPTSLLRSRLLLEFFVLP